MDIDCFRSGRLLRNYRFAKFFAQNAPSVDKFFTEGFGWMFARLVRGPRQTAISVEAGHETSGAEEMCGYGWVQKAALVSLACFSMLAGQASATPVILSGILNVSPGSDLVYSSPIINDGAINVGTSGGFFCPCGSATLEAPSITNNAGLTISAGSRIVVTHAYRQRNGGTDIAGTLISPIVRISGGFLYGASAIPGQVSIEGNVVMSGGLLNPGNVPGSLTVDGNFQLRHASFEEDLGTALDVSGTVSLGSDRLVPNPIYGIFPTEGQTFDLIDATKITGSFVNKEIPFLVLTQDNYVYPDGSLLVEKRSTGCTYGSACVVLVYSTNSISSVPAPSSVVTLLLPCCVLFWLSRRSEQRHVLHS